tara:strand:+ start:431 stop:1261 length:831 start_codon:yes stop_codon:yes gene_type:complete
MKKSQLKEAIKNEIKSLLSEDRKAKEYIQSIEDPEEREAEKKRMFGDDDLKEGFRDIEDNYGLGDHDYEIDDYEIGDQVVVANNFTTDPLNKQGEMGVVTKVDIEHEIVEVTFKDRKTGRYYPGAVIFPGSPGRDEVRESEKKRMFGDDDLKESFNPELYGELDLFIKAMAKRYGYEEQDAVYAIMAALKQRNYDGLNESEDMDDDEMDKAAAKSAKKGDSITSTSNKLQKLTKQMKDVAGSYKRAKKANATNDMEKYVEQLKKMTTEKKKLEKAL